jgi:hypothetical protein
MADLSDVLILLTEDGVEMNTVVLEASRVRSVNIRRDSSSNAGFGITLQV